jgi:hypothetical protein
VSVAFFENPGFQVFARPISIFRNALGLPKIESLKAESQREGSNTLGIHDGEMDEGTLEEAVRIALRLAITCGTWDIEWYGYAPIGWVQRVKNVPRSLVQATCVLLNQIDGMIRVDKRRVERLITRQVEAMHSGEDAARLLRRWSLGYPDGSIPRLAVERYEAEHHA